MACLAGAASAYAIGDVFSVRHSLHRKVGEAKGFYAVYFLLIAIAAAIVLAPGADGRKFDGVFVLQTKLFVCGYTSNARARAREARWRVFAPPGPRASGAASALRSPLS